MWLKNVSTLNDATQKLLDEVKRFERKLSCVIEESNRVFSEARALRKKDEETDYYPDIDRKAFASAKRASLDLSYELPKWREIVKGM